MNTIKPLSPIKPVGSSTSDADARQQSKQHAQPGQIFTATVLKSAGRNRFFLSINEQNILAQSETVSLSPGAKLKLQVLTTTPLVELKIISDDPLPAFGKTITLLGKNFDISGLFKSLSTTSPSPIDTESTSTQDILQQFPLKNHDDRTILKQLIDRLGLSLNTLMTKGGSKNDAETLNKALFEIAALFKNAEAVAETTNRFFKTLELYQSAKLKLKSDNQFIYSLPLPFLDHGYLLVNKDKTTEKAKNKDHLLRFSLHLNLKPLGNMEIHFTQSEKDLSIHFASESEEKEHFISRYRDDLKNNISSTTLLHLIFTDKAGDPTRELIQHLIPEDESMLDTKV